MSKERRRRFVRWFLEGMSCIRTQKVPLYSFFIFRYFCVKPIRCPQQKKKKLKKGILVVLPMLCHVKGKQVIVQW
jgi:hypothetical protein